MNKSNFFLFKQSYPCFWFIIWLKLKKVPQQEIEPWCNLLKLPFQYTLPFEHLRQEPLSLPHSILYLNPKHTTSFSLMYFPVQYKKSMNFESVYIFKYYKLNIMTQHLELLKWAYLGILVFQNRDHGHMDPGCWK